MDNQLDMKALFSITYGMYIVSTEAEGKLNGQIANAVMQITGDPVCVTTCLNKANLTTEMIQKSGFFAVSILELDVPMTFLGQFGFKSGRDIDKFENVKLDTHVLFVGNVVASKFIKEATPLTYADYHQIKKGKSPKTAPTFGFNTIK